ncbi:MAG: hypothetical protein AAF602_11345 [Myxococcota bacterium]
MIGLLAMLPSPAQAEAIVPLREGRYVLELHAASRAKVPVIGWTPSVTSSRVLVELRRTSSGWEQSQRVCDVSMANHKKRGETTIPDAFVASLPEKTYPVEVTGNEQGFTFLADLGIDHVGYDPALADRIPRRPDDAGVLDSDGDGFPGVTVNVRVPLIGSADVYVVQRASMRLVGDVAPDGSVTGRIEVDTLEQRTLTASHFMFKGSPELEPLPEESWFVMRPTDSARCEDLSGS